MIENGVFEKLEYPWFAPQMQVFESGEVQDMCGEDVSFCLDAQKANFEIWCDPRIRVGHEKTRDNLMIVAFFSILLILFHHLNLLNLL